MISIHVCIEQSTSERSTARRSTPLFVFPSSAQRPFDCFHKFVALRPFTLTTSIASHVLQRPPSHLPNHDSITPRSIIDLQECRTQSRRISCLCSGPILTYYHAPSQSILFFESCCHRCVVIISPCLPSAAAASTAAGCRGRRPPVQCRPTKSGHEQQRQLIPDENRNSTHESCRPSRGAGKERSELVWSERGTGGTIIGCIFLAGKKCRERYASPTP